MEKRIDQDILIQYLDAHILPILVEEIVDTEIAQKVEDFLKTSLVGIQATRKGVSLAPLVSVMQSTSNWIRSEVPNSEVRKVYSSTGLRVGSCHSILQSAKAFAENITEAQINDEKASLEFNEDLLRSAFEGCKDIPEMQLGKRIEYAGPENEFELIRDWVAGEPVHTLRSTHWTSAKSETFSEYVADRLIYKLPWGLNGFLRMLAFVLKQEYEDLPISWQYMPSMMKFGLNNVLACWAYSLSSSSRSLALQIAQEYQKESEGNVNPPNFYDFSRWLVNLPVDFFKQLKGYEFEKQRLVSKLTRFLLDKGQLGFLSNRNTLITSPIRGIPYRADSEVASLVEQGDQLELMPEPDNPYDPFAIQVLFQGKPIGYVQRDKAKIISREMRSGSKFQVVAAEVKPSTESYPFPLINMHIKPQ